MKKTVKYYSPDLERELSIKIIYQKGKYAILENGDIVKLGNK